MKIKTERLPVRCEVCHQTDFFDPFWNYCSRCANITITPLIKTEQINQPPDRDIPVHEFQELGIDPYDLRLFNGANIFHDLASSQEQVINQVSQDMQAAIKLRYINEELIQEAREAKREDRVFLYCIGVIILLNLTLPFFNISSFKITILSNAIGALSAIIAYLIKSKYRKFKREKENTHFYAKHNKQIYTGRNPRPPRLKQSAE